VLAFFSSKPKISRKPLYSREQRQLKRQNTTLNKDTLTNLVGNTKNLEDQDEHSLKNNVMMNTKPHNLEDKNVE
jgi:hypothetical protein